MIDVIVLQCLVNFRTSQNFRETFKIATCFLEKVSEAKLKWSGALKW